MCSAKTNRSPDRRRQVPSHDPMSGVDEGLIDVGASTGAQLPSRPDAGQTDRESTGKTSGKPNVNPHQGDLLKQFWPRK